MKEGNECGPGEEIPQPANSMFDLFLPPKPNPGVGKVHSYSPLEIFFAAPWSISWTSTPTAAEIASTVPRAPWTR